MLPENPNDKISFDNEHFKEIYYAGGCFWGLEAFLARVPGVRETEAGYANGFAENPSYEDVCSHTTGHAETVRVRFAPGLLPLELLTREFFSAIDPTTLNRQGGDVGSQYRSGIYYTDESDREILQQVTDDIRALYCKPLVTEILPLRCFYPAEDYHQKYLEKNPGGYCHISF